MKKSLLLVLGLAACTTQTYAPGSVSQLDFVPWMGSGPATLNGQAFLTTRGGDVKTCAGNEVQLYPANQFDLKLLNAFSRGDKIIDYAPQMASITQANIRTTVCDAGGNFEFNNIPAGPWLIKTEVRWDAGTADQVFPQGGYLIRGVSLKPGATKIIMDVNNLVGQ